MEAWLALKTDDLYEKALALSADVNENFLELGKTLRQLQERDAELFKKAMGKTKLHTRKVYYLIAIAEAFDGVKVSKAKLRAIGWTKLMVLAPHVNAQNVDELLELAEQLSTAQLKSHVKGDDPATNSHCVLMYFSPEQYNVFEQVLLKAGAQKAPRGLVNKEEVLINVLKTTLKPGGG